MHRHLLAPTLACTAALLITGCGSDDPETAAAPTTFAELGDISEVSFDDRHQETVSVDLTEATIPITDQTFVKVFRIDDDAGVNVIAISRLEDGQTTFDFVADLPADVDTSDLMFEIYGPTTVTSSHDVAPSSISDLVILRPEVEAGI